MELFSAGSLAEVDGCLRAIARRSDLTTRLTQARDEILEAMRLETIEEAEKSLDAMDRGSLEADLVEQKARFDDEYRRIRDLFAARNRAEDRIGAVGGDAAVAVIEAKRRTILVTIEDKALAYLRLRLGAAAAERALRAYRDRHRSSMMARASESFALISRGAYSELVTQPSNESEVLIAKGVGRQFEDRLRALERHSLPAILSAASSRLSRIRSSTYPSTFPRRRHHGNVR